jgi:hypothetical protein
MRSEAFTSADPTHGGARDRSGEQEDFSDVIERGEGHIARDVETASDLSASLRVNWNLIG